MALFRKFFYRKPPDGLLEISERVFVFDSCFSADVWQEGNYKRYVAGIVGQFKDHSPEASFLAFNFGEGMQQSQIAEVLSDSDMTLMEYPHQYEGTPLLTMELIHHYLRSVECWLSLGPQNLLLMHCERGGWPVLAFMLAALLIYRKQYSGEQKTLDMIYRQAPRELLQLLSPLNPVPSQLRYLHYVSRRNLASEWPPLDRALTLNCVILRLIPNFDGEGGCCPMFRIYGQAPFLVPDRTPKLLHSTRKRGKTVRTYKQAECELVKIDIDCHIQGDVVLECISLDHDRESEVMMFRVVFNTAFIRSNILMLNRDEIDMLWGVEDQFPKDFRAEIHFSEMDDVTPPVDAFAKVHEIFNSVDWLDSRVPSAIHDADSLHRRVTSPTMRHDGGSTQGPSAPPPPAPSAPPRRVTSPTMRHDGGSTQGPSALPPPAPSAPPPPGKGPAPPPPPGKGPSAMEAPTPPPPSGSLSSSKGHLNKTIPLRNNQTKKLKPLHWLKLTRAVQGSLWAETQKSGEFSKAPEIDIKELESLFSAAVPSSDHRGKSGGRARGPKDEKVQLINHRRAHHCEIMFSKVKVPLSELTSSLLNLEDANFDIDQVENLIKFAPTKEEVELLKFQGYTGDKEKLGKCKQFLLELMKVPRMESKLRVFSFKLQFSTQVSDLRRSLNTVNSAAEEIRDSVKLKRIMQTILSLGNALNHGTARGSDIEFSLDSLLKLTDYRAQNNKITLMHLCKVLSDKLPEVLDFSKDLAHLEPSSKVQLKFLAEEMQSVSKGLEKVGQELSSSEKDGPISDTFCKKLKEFLCFAEGEVRLLASLYSGVGRNVNALILYFGEDPASCPFEQVVTTLLKFVRFFNKALEENIKQQDKEMKKEAESFQKSDTKKVQLIHHRRAYNCEIMLLKGEVPLNGFRSSVLNLEDTNFDIDQVENLIKFCPTKEEMELLKGYTGDKEKLGKCEQFFLELMKVPRVESKLRVFSFKLQFSTQVSDLRKSLNTVNSAAEEIRDSAKLKRIMQTILLLGNALNRGTARGSAIGFTLDSLLKLTHTSARNNKMTLMHYLCKVLADKLPEVLDFSKDLVHLEPSSKVQLKFLAEEMQSISKGLEKVVQELSSSENDGPISDTFCKKLEEFLCFAEGEVRLLVSLYSGVGRNVDALILYFGDDPARCPFEKVVTTLLKFVRLFNKAHEENIKQQEIEMKKAAENWQKSSQF